MMTILEGIRASPHQSSTAFKYKALVCTNCLQTSAGNGTPTRCIPTPALASVYFGLIV